MRLSTLAAVLLAAPLAAQTAAPSKPPLAGPPSLSARAVEPGAIDLDGQLTEAAWADAEVARDFVQIRPAPGAPSTEPTEARVVYDGDALYVGMTLHDSRPDAILAPLGRRDADLTSDWAFVALDSYFDRRTAFVFAVNPAGVQRDLLVYEDVREDDSWDAVWDVATQRTPTGWTAEFRIPLSQLRYAADRPVQTWGLQFGRDHVRTGESGFWAPMSPDVNGMVSQFGTLSDLRDLRAPRRLELVPYAASALTRAPGDARDPYYAPTAVAPRLGLDVKYGVTSDVTLAATVNPDFGQVEQDPAQVNLGGFELFLQERRPFFVEGTDAFSMEPRRYFSTNRPNLLYTRRIGRSPQRGQFVPGDAYRAAGEDGVVYADAPRQSTILGAAKLSGRAGRFSFGVLDAVTGPEYGRFQAVAADGTVATDGRALVEPATNYAVVRARGTFGRTIVGGLATSVLRSTADPAIDGLLPAQATVAGLDVEHPLGDWTLSGQLAGSVVSGSAASIARVQRAFPRLYQRPDAGHLRLDDTRTSLAGLTGELNLLKTSGEHWLAGVHANVTTPGFDSNELGFQSRADEAGGGVVVIYNQNQPRGVFQRWGANVFTGAGWNFAGDRTTTFAGANANARFRNFWGANANVSAGPRTVDDRGTRGGPLLTDPAGGNVNVSVRSDDRKAVSGYAYGYASASEIGGRNGGGGGGLEARPSSSVTVRLGPELSRSFAPQQYVRSVEAPGLDTTFGRRYLFGELDRTTLSLDARVDWTFTPTLSLQVFARPFVSTGRYRAFRQLTEAGQLRMPTFGDGFGSVETGRFESDGEGGSVFVPDASAAEAYRLTGADGGTATLANPDFTVRALQGNAVLRWEYRPGSAFFLVWQQQRSGFATDGALRFRRDVRGLFADEVTNVFLVKLSYWLG